MIELQLLTGARPGEVVIMRPCDVDRSDDVWRYTPAEHKTKHLGRKRVIFLGPRAQAVLRPFLLRAADAYCFSPAEADQERRAALREQRTTPQSCGNRPGTNRRARPGRKPGDHYTTQSYGRAVQYACRKAFPPPDPLARREGESKKQWQKRLTRQEKANIKAWEHAHHWHPHQLRHNYATNVRRQFGLEAAQVLLGHTKADVTQVYAERDMNRAATVAAAIG